MLKKILFGSLFGFLLLSALNTGFQADARNNKNHPHGLEKKAYHLPPGHAKKHRVITKKVYVVPRTRVYVAPKNILMYKVPLFSFIPGTYYFYSQSPAYVSSNNAKKKGHKTNVYYSNNRWILQVK